MSKSSEIIDKIKDFLSSFAELEKKYPGPIQDSVQFDFKRHKGHVVFCALIHGDEIGALPAFLDVIQKLAKLNNSHSNQKAPFEFGGKVTFFIGNRPAALQNKRFLEKDLNRSFNPPEMDPKVKSHDDRQADTPERKRALSLMPLLQDADLLFDFHQTKCETKHPFYAFGFHYESYLWARIAGCTQMFVTRGSKKSFSAGGMCVDEYVRSFKKPAVTIELSKLGFTQSSKEIAMLIIKRVLNSGDKYFQKITSLKNLAHKNRELIFLLTVYKEPFSHPRKKLNEGLSNFNYVNEKQILGSDENLNPILATNSGFILFPKYPERDTKGETLESLTELFILVQQNDTFRTKHCFQERKHLQRKNCAQTI